MNFILIFFILLLSSCTTSYKLGISYIKEDTQEEFVCNMTEAIAFKSGIRHIMFDCDGKKIHILIKEQYEKKN